MANTRQTISTNNHDGNLDALLEELQTSVSRPGSSLGINGGPVSGYREVTRTITTESTGQPAGKTTEYQIEYLNPANSTTVLADFGKDLGLLKESDLHAGRNIASYKTVQYEYKTSGTQNQSVTGSDLRMHQNINELDSLLDDLHTAQRTGFADTSRSVKQVQGIDSGLLEPIDTSTPHGGHSTQSIEKRSFQEQRYGSVGRQSPAREREVKKELIFTGGSKKDFQPVPSPIQQRKEIYKYETHKTTRSGNTRDVSPPQDRRQPSPSPLKNTNSSPSSNRQITSVRSYNYSSNDQDIPRASALHRSPSPASKIAHTTVKSYQREYNSTHDSAFDASKSNRSQSPLTKVTSSTAYNYNAPEPPKAPPTSKITSVNSYNYSSTRESNKQSYHDNSRTPPPHRSPSPVAFTQPPLPSTTTNTVKTYNFETSPRPQSPQPIQKFSPSDPSRTLTYQVSPPQQQPTVISYKYSSTSTHDSKYPGEENAPLLPRPFPSPSPVPNNHLQQPPTKLDDLMASFSDTEMQQQHESTRYYPPQAPREHITPVRLESTPLPAQPSPAPAATAMQSKSKNVAGPPVYYPPGVELFSKKEEASFQQQGGGGKMKAKAKYEYEASGKSKSKSSSGKTVVPVCLPVCCAMPCSIM
uniref:Uncharacterized protein n=1 Tax=Clastoptera arizonana TaxID=38151 RepID=A0A1B6D0C4_9HEMI